MIAGPALLVLGLLGLFAFYPMLMTTDGEAFGDQIVETSSKKDDFEDYDSGDTVRIFDTIARIEQNENDQTVIWLESSGKRNGDLNFIFDADITDDYGLDSQVTLTAEVVELRGSEMLKGYDTGAEALDKDAIQPRYQSGREIFFMVMMVAGLGAGIFGAVQFFRERAAGEGWEDDEEEWGMEMEAAGAAAPGKLHKPRQPRAPKVQLPYGKLREPWVTAVLTMVTFGVYGIVWGYKVHAENKRHTNIGPGGPLAPDAPAAPGPRAAPPDLAASPVAPTAALSAAPAQPLIMQCPNCQANLQINDPTRPLNITCPGCQAGLVVR